LSSKSSALLSDLLLLIKNFILLKNYYRNNRDISYILAFASYFLNIIDANVSSHLFNFNVDDNFSLNLRPNLENKNLIFAISIKL